MSSKEEKCSIENCEHKVSVDIEVMSVYIPLCNAHWQWIRENMIKNPQDTSQ